MGQGLGQRISLKIHLNYFPHKTKEKFQNHGDFGTFMVAEAGLEPTTSGLSAALGLTFRCNATAFSSFYRRFRTNPEVIDPFHDTLSIRCYPRMGQRMGQHQNLLFVSKKTAWRVIDPQYTPFKT